MDVSPGMTIGGESVAASQTFGVINPAAGRVFAEAPECSREELDQAMEAATRALPSWSRDEAARREGLTGCGRALTRSLPELAELLTREQGKPLAMARREIFGAVAWLRAHAAMEIPVDVVQDDEARRIEVRRRPLGVVGAITPWNYPIILAMWKIAPALLAGNTVVLKPSPFTPLSTLRLGEVLGRVLPPGVLNVVSGGDEVGRLISRHEAVRKISFTGSVATGRKVLIAGAEDLKRVTLELGGNDAAIVLGDADPERIAEKLFWGAFENSGQVCSAIKRLYVARGTYEPLLEAIGAIARSVRMGDGLDPGVELGPVNNRPQFDKVCELVEDAKQAGATIVTGGDRMAGDGYFLQPTILADVSDETRIVAEEQFGPALPVLPFDDPDEAIERANSSRFGLGGSVWSSNVELATELATRLECGSAWVNQHSDLTPLAPFGGFKWSGIGRENGSHGLDEFVELQTVNVARD